MEQKIIESLNKLYPVDITEIQSVTNEMYRCKAKQGVFFARITNYKSYEAQLEEVNYTNYLYSKGFGVSPAIASIHGKSVERIELDRNVITVLYKAAPGVHLARNQWNAGVLKELGRQIGRLHHITKEYEKLEKLEHINDWYDNEEYFFQKYIPEEESSIREIAHEVFRTIKDMPKDDETYGLIHGDLWLENILVDKNTKLTMVDFQDCEKHFYIFDLAVPIFSALEYSFVGTGNILDYARAITEAIIEGYKEENELSGDMLKLFPHFIKLKEIFDYNTMHMYWDKENLTEEQIRIMNHFRMRIERNLSFLP